jgi:hypothetical protein
VAIKAKCTQVYTTLITVPNSEWIEIDYPYHVGVCLLIC